MNKDLQTEPTIEKVSSGFNDASTTSVEKTSENFPDELVGIHDDDGQKRVVYLEEGYGLYINTQPERTQIDESLIADQIKGGSYVVPRPFTFNAAAGIVAQNVALNDLADAWETGAPTGANFKATIAEIMGGDKPDIKAAFAATQPVQDGTPTIQHEIPTSDLA